MLARSGTAVAEKVHGRRRTGEGYLVVRDHYLFADQERALGWCYLASPERRSSSPAFGTLRSNMASPLRDRRFPPPTSPVGAVMPADVEILTIVAIAGWASCFAAMFRLVVLNIAIKEQPLSDLD